MAESYLTIEQFFAEVPGALTTDEVSVVALERRLASVSRAIDKYTRRDPGAFSPSPAEPTALVVYGTGATVLPLIEFVPGSVSIVGAPSHYMPSAWREYRRGDVRGLHVAAPDGRLITDGEVWGDGVPFTVTARFGYIETPADVVEAAVQLAARWHRAGSEGFSGVIGALQSDRTIIERAFPPTVKLLLDPYVEQEPTDEDARIDVGRLLPGDFV